MTPGDTLGFQTIFDASQQGLSWMWLATPMIGLGFVAMGIYWIRTQAKSPGYGREVGMLLAGLFAMFGACFSIWFVANTISDHNQAMQSLQKGTALVIEGPVDNFTVSAFGKAENFTVKGIQFSYSEFSDSEGFHHTSAYGGPMKAGLFIRIHYITLEGDPSEPAILKLEVRK
jgi:hypothetical protein